MGYYTAYGEKYPGGKIVAECTPSAAAMQLKPVRLVIESTPLTCAQEVMMDEHYKMDWSSLMPLKVH